MHGYFQLLPKLGNSNISEQQEILAKIIPLLEKYKICVLADRTFCPVRLAKYLQRLGVYFCLRLKKNEFVEIQKDIFIELKNLGLAPGIFLFLQGIKITKTRDFMNFNLAYKWQYKIREMAAQKAWFILTNFENLELAISAYKQRFGIEEMFHDFKKGSYNLEGTNVEDKRLILLIFLIIIAYINTTICGRQIKSKGVQEYVYCIKKLQRLKRRYSSFFCGLIWSNLDQFSEYLYEISH